MTSKKSADNDPIYHPSEEILKSSRVKDYDCLYKESIENREKFWEVEAEKLLWYKKWDRVLDDTDKPFYKWYTGGKINIIANAIDRHLNSDTRNKLALIWEGEPGDVRTFSFYALNIKEGLRCDFLECGRVLELKDLAFDAVDVVSSELAIVTLHEQVDNTFGSPVLQQSHLHVRGGTRHILLMRRNNQ